MREEEYYLDYLKKTNKFPQSIYHRAKHEMVGRVLGSLPAGSVILDAGCGIGHITNPYCGLYSIVGIDEQLSAVKHCGQFCRGRYAQAELYNIPFFDDTFDAAFLLDTIEHLEQPMLALRELFRVLKQGGLILVCTMNYANPLWVILENTWHRFAGGSCKPYSKAVHPTQYTEEILRRHCNDVFREIYMQKRVMNMELFYLGRK